MARYYDRYMEFKGNGENKTLPNITIKASPSDITILYKLGETRLDKVSNTYYGTPYYGWLILLANPEYGGLEFLIPDQSTIRVPLPLDTAIQNYMTEVKKYKTLYG